MNGKRILLVEDDPNDRYIFKEKLKGSGLAIDEATTVREAEQKVAFYRKYRYVFVDLKLNGVSAIPLILWIRQNYSACPVVVLTGDSGLTQDQQIQLYAMGCTRIYQKPFTAANLEEIMSRLHNLSETWKLAKEKWSWRTTLCGTLVLALAAYSWLREPSVLAFAMAIAGAGLLVAGDKKATDFLEKTISKLRG